MARPTVCRAAARRLTARAGRRVRTRRALAFYSAGLAIPFLATALAFSRMTALFAGVRRHVPLVIAAGGGILVVMGVLIWTGELFTLNIQAQRLMDHLGLDFLTSV